MKSLKKRLLEFLREEEGLTTVEYAIAGTLVGLSVVLAFSELGNAVDISITKISPGPDCSSLPPEAVESNPWCTGAK